MFALWDQWLWTEPGANHQSWEAEGQAKTHDSLKRKMQKDLAYRGKPAKLPEATKIPPTAATIALPKSNWKF